ncbi:MAG TPA: KilA-N domain-containing protein [Candidatus Paceibacterota bacterium]|nr:KilA-N domain-containing protein [Candidatus Paceibacterota bacterium]
MTNLVFRSFNNVEIPQRADGYINATKMCQAGEKEWSSFSRTQQASEYIDALASVLQICRTEIIETTQGGNPRLQGTWIHPRLASRLAQWVSPEFAVVVDGWVLEIMQSGSVGQGDEIRKLELQLEVVKAQIELTHAQHTLTASRQPVPIDKTVVGFVAECVTVLPPAYRRSVTVDMDHVYSLYSIYCNANGLEPRTINMFKGYLRMAIPECYAARRRVRATERDGSKALPRMKPATWHGFTVEAPQRLLHAAH